MKISVLCTGFSHPHVGWVAIDELAKLMVYYFDAELLSPVRLKAPWPMRTIRPHRQHFETIDTKGGDVLFVVAHSPGDLEAIKAIPRCRQKFKKIYAWVTDSYFYADFPLETAWFDAITVTAIEDMPFVENKFKIEVKHLYQGADCLTWVPKTLEASQRSIDLIGFGRNPPSYHKAFSRHFHDAASPYLYLHSPLGNISGPDVHTERGMLFKLLQRSKVSMAFHLFVEPQVDRPRSMMVTSRWLESLLSGCIVAGQRPQSQMADDMLCWPGSTLELSSQPLQAVEQLEHIFTNDNEFHDQRRLNIHEMLLRHDWRKRIQVICNLWNWPIPHALQQDLEKIARLAASFDSK